jgi:hypothetical protein
MNAAVGVQGPAVFFDAACEAFEKAAAGRLIERRYCMGGQVVLFRFAGPAMVPLMTPAIEHLAAPSFAAPDLTVQVFDNRSTGGKMPPAPWARECHGRRGLIEGYNDGRFFTVYEVGIDILHMFDAKRNTAIYWVRDYQWIPYWETSFPIRSILHWWLRGRPLQLVHAGAVGTASGGVLIAGKSGSGKSTTTLSCFASDLLYAGDDYVLTDLSGEPYVHALYSTAKLEPDNVHRFPHMRPLISNPDNLDKEKALIFLDQHFPQKLTRGFPIRAILLPAVTGLRDTRLVRVGPMAAFKAIAPTTLLHLPRVTEEATRKISLLSRSAPVYLLEAGTDLAQIPQVISGLLRNGQ